MQCKMPTNGGFCYVLNCSRDANQKNVSFFRFPQNEVLCRKWVMNIRRPGLLNIPIKELRKKTVCSKHFEDRMFSNYQKNRLYPDAVPTLNIINNRYEEENFGLNTAGPSTSRSFPEIFPKIDNLFLNKYERTGESSGGLKINKKVQKTPKIDLGKFLDYNEQGPSQTKANTRVPNPASVPKQPFKKRRIVDIIYFLEQIKNLATHNESNNCNFKHLSPRTEICNGFQSTIIFNCSNCDQMFAIDLIDKNDSDLNSSIVNFAEATNLQYGGLNFLCETIDFPLMNNTQYDNINMSTEQNLFINNDQENLTDDYEQNVKLKSVLNPSISDENTSEVTNNDRIVDENALGSKRKYDDINDGLNELIIKTEIEDDYEMDTKRVCEGNEMNSEQNNESGKQIDTCFIKQEIDIEEVVIKQEIDT